ncbi:extracellular solute-binding protein [Ilumatobacter nonamiensis]|uniref:extracellular solute-binding protein n=1 Tax=Ilumatobacter nonamiensis TaxID=467093 RepID=UPI000348E92E|nr:extracellular solute-binding protein [Ilumatobacter nonamiensis]
MRTTPVRLVSVLTAAALLAAACTGGDSVLDAGNDDPPETAAPVTTPTVSEPSGSAPDSEVDSTPDQPDAEPDDTAPPETVGPTTTIAPLADLPPCPVEALDAADGPVSITFWHAMANELETALVDLVAGYNSSQDRVQVTLQNQTAYESAIDKYIAGGVGSRPDIVQLPEYVVQAFAQSGTFVPMQACIEAADFDMGPILPRIADTYVFEGIQWAMPFNTSGPVLYFNRQMFEAAGLDPDDPPVSLEELRAASQQLVDSGAAGFGIALDSGRDSGGGWFFEQWFGRAGEPFADNGNGRIAPATEVLFDNDLGLELLTYLQDMTASGLAVTVGDNSGGQDTFFKMIAQDAPAASTIATSAAISSVVAALGSGVAEGLTPDDIGVGPMPGPSDTPSAQPGGASIWIPAGKSDEVTAAAWDFTTYLAAAQTQSTWAAATGYVPMRSDAVELDPIAALYAADPRYRVAYDQLLPTVDDASAVVPALGPLREIRAQTADAVAATYAGGNVEQILADAAAASNALITTYNSQN